MNEIAPYGTYAPRGLVRWVLERTRRLPRSWAGMRLIFLLRRVAIKALRGAPVDIETLGARMRLHPYNNVSEKRVLFTPQFFDRRSCASSRAGSRRGLALL